ncbi:hypothetical protein [Pseudomonas baetica]|uniref:hypothetical protein n=1 Tax=Pseudomonas baetica TaxID=674054 RepID=UPI00240730FB|nr:hypothetical protein [Pseudomonas baetica]MDF9774779.1 hypothetical protein [Pseudomonas baetica]
MNISAAASFQIPYPQTVKTNTENALPEKVDIPAMDDRLRLTIEKLRAPRSEARNLSSEKLNEVEAFLNALEPYNEFTDLPPLIKSFRYSMIRHHEFQANLMLKKMEGVYSDFKKDLQSKWPGLANNVMGFTVAEDGQLKVTSPPNTLTAKDEDVLNTLLNKAKDLQPLTLKHAKTVIELIQLDKPQFEGKVNLDLSNFHKMIDYGLLLNKGALNLGSSDSWLDQLHKKAEKEPGERKQGLHIEA